MPRAARCCNGLLALLLYGIAAIAAAAEPVYLTGTVLDLAGRGLGGVTVTQAAPEPKVTTKTDTRGQFRLGPLEPSVVYFVDLALPGHTPLHTLVNPNESNATLVLAHNGTLRVRALDGDSRVPLDKVSFAFRARDTLQGLYDIQPGPRSLMAPDGRFELRDVYAGSWTLVATAPGYEPSDLPVEVRPGQTTEAVVQLRRGGTLRGRVVESPIPFAAWGARLQQAYLTQSMANK